MPETEQSQELNQETEFTTSRLLVRRWGLDDSAALLAVYGDVEAMRWVDDGRPLTSEECHRWLHVTGQNYARRGYGMFAVERLSNPSVIGFCGIVHPRDQQEPEVKYAFRREYWGQGFATEAVIGLIDYGATSHALKYIIATTAPANKASHRVLLKAGMQQGALRSESDGSQTLLFQWTRRP